jgi:hypothetical protein
MFITGWEILLRISLRQHFPRLYSRLLDNCLALDRHLPALGTFYAVVQQAAPPESPEHGGETANR